jgi:4-diphosphocytidyl-2C-methyl-D-erythritol kinase
VVGVLNGMARLYGITDRGALKALADRLGSDTGYMLTGGFARMQGRGDLVTPLAIKEKLHLLLICPDSGVSAGACYTKYDQLPHTLQWKESATQGCIDALLKSEPNEGGRYLMNDLYVPALHLNTDVEKAYNEAKSFSPLGVTMSGSGSTVLAMFETKELCDWAKSRYKGKFRTYVVQTIVPDYTNTKKAFGWRNPFVLTDLDVE